MRIVTPAPAGSRKGNRVTALRWAMRLRELGHRVAVEQAYAGGGCDVLVALHAARSHASVMRYRGERPRAPLVVGIAGTDLYRDLATSAEARESLEVASRLVALQARAADALPAHLREKVYVIPQSARGLAREATPDAFTVCVLGHLRPVKDPLRAALAARRLPASSRVRVVHVGAALDDAMAARAREEMAANPRYAWLGERPRAEGLCVLASSHLMALTSELEGGANVVSEAIACGVPVVSSRIDGSVGLLGDDYPGYFPVGDTGALTDLLLHCERDGAFYETLRTRCRALADVVAPARERALWEALLAQLLDAG